jgi:hypothetical protein
MVARFFPAACVAIDAGNEPSSYFGIEQEMIDPQPGFACELAPQGKNRSATKEHVGMSNIHGLAILLR